MAANSPMAVAMSASAMPGATTDRSVDPCAPMFENAVMMPHTVPKSPMNGVMLAVVARKVICRSSLATSAEDARNSARSMALRLRIVGRAGAPASAPEAGAGDRSWAFSSANPAWNMPTSGLADREGQTACASENFALVRKACRNWADCRRARPSATSRPAITAQATTEKMTRMTSTT